VGSCDQKLRLGNRYCSVLDDVRFATREPSHAVVTGKRVNFEVAMAEFYAGHNVFVERSCDAAWNNMSNLIKSWKFDIVPG